MHAAAPAEAAAPLAALPSEVVVVQPQASKARVSDDRDAATLMIFLSALSSFFRLP
jgi:hypothetical protein